MDTQTIKSTIALLSSMADGGEKHSPRSKQQVWQSFKDLEDIDKCEHKLKSWKEFLQNITKGLCECQTSDSAYCLRCKTIQLLEH